MIAPSIFGAIFELWKMAPAPAVDDVDNNKGNEYMCEQPTNQIPEVICVNISYFKLMVTIIGRHTVHTVYHNYMHKCLSILISQKLKYLNRHTKFKRK